MSEKKTVAVNVIQESRASGRSSGKSLPLIIHKDSAMRRITRKSLRAIAKANRPPTLFQQGGILVRIKRWQGKVRIEPLTVDSMRCHLDLSATFGRRYPLRGKEGKDTGETKTYREPPPYDFVKDILAQPEWPTDVFPILKGIVRCPFFTPRGRLVTAPGYNEETQLWYEPEPGLVIDPVPTSPTKDDIQSARNWLDRELLGDFPFQHDADRTNAHAYLLTPFVREMVQGPVPLGLLEAPSAGTGKGLTANALAMPSTGQVLAALAQRTGDDEWRKAITAHLMESPTYLLLDNLTGTLRSPSLESLLTTSVWTDRILGETRVVDLDFRSVVMVTANNLLLGGDLARRTVWIRLDAKMERPEDRDPATFRHKDLLRWAKDNRGKLIWAALVLVQAWVSKGMTPGTEVMGSYESWVQVLGGILRDVGMTDFLKNLQFNRFAADDDASQLRPFVNIWWKEYKDAPVAVAKLYDLVAERDDLLPYVMSGDNDIDRRKRLGNLLKRSRDKVIDGKQIVLPFKSKHTKTNVYYLKQLEEEPKTTHVEVHFKGLLEGLTGFQSPVAEKTEGGKQELDGNKCDVITANDEAESDLDEDDNDEMISEAEANRRRIEEEERQLEDDLIA